ncbi:MAG TPA: TMEM175 family protein [Candidatus Thermoplasmatota archaeon]|nr:TMEM175 family protein [Candidatus Thermoplasmatota archaeon]
MFARRRNSSAGLTKERLENVVDGITGFVLTVLIFDIVVPEAGKPLEELPAMLLAQRQALFTFLVTAAVIATFWLGHAQQMNFITRLDRPLVWINFVGLTLVVLLPFTTSLLGRYLGAGLPTAIYGANVGLIGATGLAQWAWATRHPHLVRVGTPPEAVRDMTMRIGIGLAFTAVGITAAAWSAWASMFFYALAFLPFVLPGAYDDHLVSGP